ncbi:protein CLEC16A homolog isoform X2 [Bemisia tabaci]|uniref:protein CLEC16A homolog isoform X2 n=1 Tax=Bemisia tabaci TaxID=7038 RepID=UPI003B27B51A
MYRLFGGFGKPKNPHSLENLKHLYNVLLKNKTVTDNNRGLLVEVLRSITEILIWGDQNDSSVFDFFLERNMLSFFLEILKQKCGSYVNVQLLQTLNILFENIRNETSLYYLLSNNHVNSIIVHKFDFSDEEVMAYYISFLKTLSLKLNVHTVNFFYNVHTNDFPLYTEAIKFFNHPESMVRIAVRTLTLNVYKVGDKSMLSFIRNKTAAPYFSNLVWFIGSHVLELDACVSNDANNQNQIHCLADLVAEHLDHLHYLNDILTLDISDLNEVLNDHLLNKLLTPLYIFSLIPDDQLKPAQTSKPRMSTIVSLFLLSQVFLIISMYPLVRTLTEIILQGSLDIFEHDEDSPVSNKLIIPSFVPPPKTLEESLDSATTPSTSIVSTTESNVSNITDEEKEQILAQELQTGFFFETIIKALSCEENDHKALFALCLLHSISCNKGINQDLLAGTLIAGPSEKPKYNTRLVEKLIEIMSLSCQPRSGIRLVTLELTIALLKRLVVLNGRSILQDAHFAAVIDAKEESIQLAQTFFKNDDVFLDTFEDEYTDMKRKPLNVEFLMMDSKILLSPSTTCTPLTGIEFRKRLPCGNVERARRAIRVFLLIREFSLMLTGEMELQLPLTDRSNCYQVNSALDFNNADLIHCIFIGKDGIKAKRFLVIDSTHLILIEPDSRLGWGIVKLAAFLQDIEVVGDKENPQCLSVTMHHSTSGALTAKFIFDDHVRCMAAKQRLTKARTIARVQKLNQLARLFDLPVQTTHSSPGSRMFFRHPRSGGRRLPGFAAPIKVPSSSFAAKNGSSNGHCRSLSSSPKPSTTYCPNEDIPLENIALKTINPANVASSVEEQSETSNASSSQDAPVNDTAEPSDLETSFSQISVSSKKTARRKGKVETV